MIDPKPYSILLKGGYTSRHADSTYEEDPCFCVGSLWKRVGGHEPDRVLSSLYRGIYYWGILGYHGESNGKENGK